MNSSSISDRQMANMAEEIERERDVVQHPTYVATVIFKKGR